MNENTKRILEMLKSVDHFNGVVDAHWPFATQLGNVNEKLY